MSGNEKSAGRKKLCWASGKMLRTVRLKKYLMREQGMTLIEVMVAMMIFLAVSTGVAGTIITGLKANVRARAATFGKEVAMQRIEEIRARPYYVPYSTDINIGTTGDIDLLDRYYPDVLTSPSTDGQGWTGRYYSGSDAHYTKISPPDSRGITVTVETRFVDANNIVVAPPTAYDSDSTGNDTPPSELIDVIVTTSWDDASAEHSFSLESQVSSVGQTPPVSESGCANAIEGGVDVQGAILIADTGTGEPYTEIVNGVLGDAHAAAVYPCDSIFTASSTGGDMVIVGGSDYKGAVASATGPPAAHQSVPPTSAGPPSSYPKPTISNSRAEAKIEDEDSFDEVEVEGEASAGTETLELAGVSGTPSSGSMSGYKRWDFINPAITITGSDGEEDDKDIEAEIKQKDGEATGKAEIYYQQINVLPLQKWPTSTDSNPSAAQGVVFIRDFRASAHATTDGTSDGVDTDLTYSFQLGMFNPNKSGCSYSSTGDACYELIDVSDANPIQNVSLDDAKYRLQKALITEWHSYNSTEIGDAIIVSDDGKTVTISADTPLIQISAKYGTEIRWKTSNNAISLITQSGLQELGIGKIDISVNRDG